MRQALADHVGQLGEPGLRGQIAARDDADLRERAARGVGVLHHTARALGDVQDEDAACTGGLQHLEEILALIGEVPAAVRLEHQALERGPEEVLEDVAGDARIDPERRDVRREAGLHVEGATVAREEQLAAHLHVDAHPHQGGQVRRLEGVEAGRVVLARAVAAEELVVEVDAHLGDGPAERRRVRREAQRSEEVVEAIVPQLHQGDLRAREDHRLLQPLEHEAQGRGGVRHGVGAVEDHEAVVVLHARADVAGDLRPRREIEVRRVQERLVLDHLVLHASSVSKGGRGEAGKGRVTELRQLLEELGERRAVGLVAARPLAHADRAAGVEEEDLGRFVGISVHGVQRETPQDGSVAA